MSTTAKVSNTITFAVVSCHHAHPRHNDKLNSRLYALGYTKLIQVECGRYNEKCKHAIHTSVYNMRK